MDITVEHVIRMLESPDGACKDTVDGLLAGSYQTRVRGIVTCFMPSMAVLEKAIKLGANLVISHEGLFYSHSHDNELKGSAVCQKKRSYVDSSGLCIYRCHDYPHRSVPDVITEGLIRALDWMPFISDIQPHATLLDMPATKVRDIAGQLKKSLHIPSLRVIGNTEMECRRAGVLVGYRGGGKLVIPLIEREKLDLVLYGEGPEWETPEYIRDSLYFGNKQALIVLGHGESEEPGMAVIADQLRRQFPHIPTYYIKGSSLFQSF
jgi:putative NIF3 family GTP cyclohydrolase 1 type 2